MTNLVRFYSSSDSVGHFWKECYFIRKPFEVFFWCFIHWDKLCPCNIRICSNVDVGLPRILLALCTLTRPFHQFHGSYHVVYTTLDIQLCLYAKVSPLCKQICVGISCFPFSRIIGSFRSHILWLALKPLSECWLYLCWWCWQCPPMEFIVRILLVRSGSLCHCVIKISHFHSVYWRVPVQSVQNDLARRRHGHLLWSKSTLLGMMDRLYCTGI